MNYTASLRVNLPPSWVVAPTSSTCRLGHSVRLDCSARGEPQPTIQWLRLSQEQETPISRSATMIVTMTMIRHYNNDNSNDISISKALSYW